jgi:hypothetical protein
MLTDPDSMVYHLQDQDRPYFYLGSPEPSWLARDEFCGKTGYDDGGKLRIEPRVPLFVSHRRLARLKTMPRARTPWALDSGGFTELSMYGDWTVHPVDYAKTVRRYHDQIGCMEWAAPQDWMCEPWILQKTGRTVQDHQLRTVANYLDLRYEDDYLPWIPVLQGWARDDYLRCADMYATAGLDLSAEPLVGLGSVCRRQNTDAAVEIIRALRSWGVTRLHGFGFKTTGLRAAHQLLESSDSMAWSLHARRSSPLPGCTHKSCANCPRFAAQWRQRLLASMPDWHQPVFDLDIAA